jgi:hypothetical protein
MPKNLTDELKKLAELRASGALTEEAFAEAKKNLLQGFPPFVTKKETAKPNVPNENTPTLKEDVTLQFAAQTEEHSYLKQETGESDNFSEDTSASKVNASPRASSQHASFPKNMSSEFNSDMLKEYARIRWGIVPSDMLKAFVWLGIAAGIVLIVMAFMLEKPSRDISTSYDGDRSWIDRRLYSGPSGWQTPPKKYVGGDAYNYQIEASLRGGEIAGAMVAKAVYLTGGLILFFGSSIALEFSKKIGRKQKATMRITP